MNTRHAGQVVTTLAIGAALTLICLHAALAAHASPSTLLGINRAGYTLWVIGITIGIPLWTIGAITNHRHNKRAELTSHTDTT